MWSQLVSRADNQLVVMSTGDEMTVRFNAGRFPPLRKGWVRSFFLDASGYAKDGEPNTAYSATVDAASLPLHAKLSAGSERPFAAEPGLPGISCGSIRHGLRTS